MKKTYQGFSISQKPASKRKSRRSEERGPTLPFGWVERSTYVGEAFEMVLLAHLSVIKSHRKIAWFNIAMDKSGFMKILKCLQ